MMASLRVAMHACPRAIACVMVSVLNDKSTRPRLRLVEGRRVEALALLSLYTRLALSMLTCRDPRTKAIYATALG